MNIKTQLSLFLLVFTTILVSQNKQNLREKFLNKFNFKEYKIPLENDTVFFICIQKKRVILIS